MPAFVAPLVAPLVAAPLVAIARRFPFRLTIERIR